MTALLSGKASETGPIGDTVGGLTAPVVSLLNAVLVYHAFRQQLIANKIQREAIEKEQARYESQRDFEVLLKLFEKIEIEAKKITFHRELKNGRDLQLYGSNAVEEALFFELEHILKHSYNDLSQHSKEYLFTVDLPSGKVLWRNRNNRDSIINICAYDPEIQINLSTAYLYITDSIVPQYLSLLPIVNEWAQRLDVSRMSFPDKTTLTQGFMSFLVDSYFNLSSFAWLRIAVKSDDKLFNKALKLEANINSILSKYRNDTHHPA